MDIYKYTVEFTQRDYIKYKSGKVRPITDELLREFLRTIESRSKEFKAHPDVFGMADGGRIRYVHFYSNLTYGYVNDIATKFAEAHRYKHMVRGWGMSDPKKNIMEEGGLVGWLNQKVTLKSIFTR